MVESRLLGMQDNEYISCPRQKQARKFKENVK